MLGTTVIAASLLQSGTLSSAEGLTSDHLALIFVNIDYVELLQLDTVNETIPNSRPYTSIWQSRNAGQVQQRSQQGIIYDPQCAQAARLDYQIR
jgi:hypothetical protein